MADAITMGAMLLVVGPLVGIALVMSFPWGAWVAPRDVFLVTVGAHRRRWLLANFGFGLATVLTSAGLLILALAWSGDEREGAALVAAAVIYAIGGALWCAVLGIRNNTTPVLADLVAAGDTTEPAESLLAAASGGLFAGFALATCVALVALGGTLLAAGGVVVWVALACVLVGVIGVVWLLVAGDVIPAVFYLPTLFVGIALLFGWT